MSVTTFSRRRLAQGLAVGALSLGLLGSAFAAGIQVTEAWIRWLPANLPAGGYAKVTNDTDKEVKLVGASSPKYGMVMLHQTVNKNGMSNMVHVDAIPIAPHKSMAFTPGDYHIMLMQPKPGWHGYWQNPGDAGLGMGLEWTLPAGAKAGAPQYPVPETLLISGLMNHVYEHDYAVLVPLTLPATARARRP